MTILIDPNRTLSATERHNLRFQRFQDFLQQNFTAETNTVEFEFLTSIENNNIFTPNVWNNRIAGVGLPADVPGTEGISLNIETRQFCDVGTPAIILTHGGHASYRTVTGDIIEYTPSQTNHDLNITRESGISIKLRLLIGLFIFVVVWFAFPTYVVHADDPDKSGVSPQVISWPSGPGSIEGIGESFEPDLSTGTASYPVKF